MSKIKLIKGELKKQRDSLKQFQHYLPTLQLKKQQLQMKILEARKEIESRLAAFKQKEEALGPWVGLFVDPAFDPQYSLELPGEEKPLDLKPLINPQKIMTDSVNIAGANIPVLKDIQFNEVVYDFYSTPLWVDRAIEELREMARYMVEIAVFKKQISVLEKELRITTQRVNLFEKIKIPECKNNIRVIRIYLGDQQANAVGISKVAKKKVEQRSVLELALV